MTSTNPRSAIWVRWLLGLFTTIFLLLAALHLSAGLALNRIGEHFLHPEPDRGFNVGETELNLFTGRLRVEGVSLSRDGEERLRIGTMELKLDPLSLFSDKPKLELVDMDDSFIQLVRDENGQWQLPALPPETNDEESEPTGADSPLALALDQLRITDFQIHLRDSQGDETIRLDQVEVNDIDLGARLQTLPFWLVVELGQGKLEASGDILLPSDAEPGIATELSLTNLDLAKLNRWGELPIALAGQGELVGELRFAEHQLRYDGSLGLTRLALAVEGQKVQTEQLRGEDLQVAVDLGRQGLEQASLSGRLNAQGMALTAPDGTLRLGELALADLAVDARQQDEVWHANLKTSLTAGAVRVHQDPLALNLAQGKLATLAIELAGEQIKLATPIALSGIEFSDDTQQASLQGLTIGRLQLDQADGIQLALENGLGLDQLAFSGPSGQASLAKLDVDGGFLLEQTDRLALAAKQAGNIRLEQLDWQDPQQAQVSTGGLDYQFQSLSFEQAADQLNLTTQGVLNLTPTRVALPEHEANWDALKADLDLALQGDSPNLKARLDLQGLVYKGLGHLLELAEFQGQDLAVQGHDFAAGQLNLAKLALRVIDDPEERTARAERVEIDALRVAEQEGLDIGSLIITSLDSPLVRTPEGHIRLPTSFIATATGQEAMAADAEMVDQSEPAMPVRIGEFVWQGDNYVHFADRGIESGIKKDIHIQKLRLGEVDTRKPDQDTSLSVIVVPDEYSKFTLDGMVRPLAPQMNWNVQGKLTGLGLAELSPYARDAIGHDLVAGDLDNSFTIKLADRQVDMHNDIVINGLQVESIPDKEGPPLALAITLLEDSQGKISVSVPVQGDLDDPDFSVSGALDPIIMKAVAAGAALAIQPLGSVVAIGALVGSEAMAIRFNPAEFEPGSAQLSAATRDYLGQLKTKLDDRPKMAIKLCGRAVTADLPPPPKPKLDKDGKPLPAEPGPSAEQQEAKLKKLADQRAAAVRQQLISQGMKEERLLACRPAVLKDAEAQPMVEIGF